MALGSGPPPAGRLHGSDAYGGQPSRITTITSRAPASPVVQRSELILSAGLRALIVSTSRARGSLVASRSLADAGWIVGVGTPDGDGLAARSRSTTHAHVVPRPRGDHADFVAAVRRAERDVSYDVVFGGGDDWMAALALHAERFDATVAHPDYDVVVRGLDKYELADAATSVGLATPTTVPATPASIEAWSGPVIVKCRSHWASDLHHPFRVEAARYDSIGDDALARIRSIEQRGLAPMLQRPIDGQLGALVGLFDGRRLHGRVQQRALRVWPTPTGVSSRAVTVPIDEHLVERAEALLGELGWTGLVELQFIHDDADVPHLIDLNARFYGSMALATHLAGNLPDAWGRRVLDPEAPVDLRDAPPSRRYLWFAGDVRRASTERNGGLLRDLWSTLRWACSRRLTWVWRPWDLGPSMRLVVARLRRSPVDPEA